MEESENKPPIPKSIFRDPQNIIAMGVTVISLCALLVSLMQTSIMREERELLREHSRASVWPRIELGMSKAHHPDNGSITHFSFRLTNSGIGPAIITDVKMTYKDKIATDWWHLFQLQEIPDSIKTTINNAVFNKRIIKIGETFEVLNLEDNLPLAQAFFDRFSKDKKGDLLIEIYYKSIYGEQWKYNGDETVPLENFEGLPEEEQFK